MYYLITVLFLLMAKEIILPYQYSAIGGCVGSCGGMLGAMQPRPTITWLVAWVNLCR